jgi:hypothetical protein
MAPKKSDQGNASASTAGAAKSKFSWTEELNGLLWYAAEHKIPWEKLTQAKKNSQYIFGDSKTGYGYATLRTRVGYMKSSDAKGENAERYIRKVPTEDDVKLHYPEIYALQPTVGKPKMNKEKDIWTANENVRFVELMYRDGYQLKEIMDKNLLGDRSKDSIVSHWKRGLRPDYLFGSEPPKHLQKQLEGLRGLAEGYRIAKKEKDFNYVNNYGKKDTNTDHSEKASSGHDGGSSKRDAGSSDENRPAHKKKHKTTESQPKMPDIANIDLSDKRQKEKEKADQKRKG